MADLLRRQGFRWFAPSEKWHTVPRLKDLALDLKEHKRETLVNGVSDFEVSADHKVLAYRAGPRLRVFAAGSKPPVEPDRSAAKRPGRRSGWIDLSRLRV